MKQTLSILASFALILLILWVMIAGMVFKFRNPTANDASLLTHFLDVMSFKKLDKFQGNQ